MALQRLTIDGYGQLEINFFTAPRDGQIEAQCKLNETDFAEMPAEVGMLLAVDNINRRVKLPVAGEPYPIAINYSTEHMYDEREMALKNFKLDKNTFCPRLGYIGVADKFTTNTVCYDDAAAINTYKYGKACAEEGFEGYIELTNTREGAHVEVLDANTTMPDGQAAVKFGGLN